MLRAKGRTPVFAGYGAGHPVSPGRAGGTAFATLGGRGYWIVRLRGR
jgi:hypothetical protein